MPHSALISHYFVPKMVLLTGICRVRDSVEFDASSTPIRVAQNSTVIACCNNGECQGKAVFGCHHAVFVDMCFAQPAARIDDRVVYRGHARVAHAEELRRGDVDASVVMRCAISAAVRPDFTCIQRCPVLWLQFWEWWDKPATGTSHIGGNTKHRPHLVLGSTEESQSQLTQKCTLC